MANIYIIYNGYWMLFQMPTPAQLRYIVPFGPPPISPMPTLSLTTMNRFTSHTWSWPPWSKEAAFSTWPSVLGSPIPQLWPRPLFVRASVFQMHHFLFPSSVEGEGMFEPSKEKLRVCNKSPILWFYNDFRFRSKTSSRLLVPDFARQK